MKEGAVYSMVGIIGSFIASLFGGFDAALITLMMFMGIDYLSGVIVAGVFHKSNKTQSGSLESRAGWKGLCRKGMTLIIVLIAARLDLIIGTTYVRDAVCLAFIANETISIIENAGIMGVPIPPVLTKAIEVLKDRKPEGE